MDGATVRTWWSSWRQMRRTEQARDDFGDHGTELGLDASLDRPHEPSSRLTGLPTASDFTPLAEPPQAD